ncbi:putative carboxylesterase 18 [Iris pallida]|uniref:Carboxylesterase 18 n=1 Tax=Iris pallida TaxID=29817 RepID=A0AAX6GV84_IRIPA|nr:putative carboxylesterase 18 [Iris pallida]
MEGSPLTSSSGGGGDDGKSKPRTRARRYCCLPAGGGSREPTFPLKIRLFYFLLNAAFRAVARRDGTLAVNRKLFSFLDLSAPPSPTPDADGVSTSDHVVDPARNLFVRHFLPSAPPPPAARLPVIVYFHGGGFVSGSAVDRPMDGFCRLLAGRTPAHVVSVEYRLAPEHRFPAPYDDGEDVLRWLDGGGGPVPADCLSAVFLAGDSAGGNIAHHVARRAARPGGTLGRLRVVGVVAIQPFLGGEEETESERRVPFVSWKYIRMAWRAFLPEGASLDHEAASVFGPGGSMLSTGGPEDWAGFPETMVVIGEWDPFQDRQRWYCDGLRRVGVRVHQVEYAHAVHAFFMFDKSQREQLVKEVGEFVRRRCADLEEIIQ